MDFNCYGPRFELLLRENAVRFVETQCIVFGYVAYCSYIYQNWINPDVNDTLLYLYDYDRTFYCYKCLNWL